MAAPALTAEREIIGPVRLCTPDGRRLAPDARGWSRQPFHEANLLGGWPRTKRWDYWAVLAGDLVVSTTFADVDYLGLVTVWWADLATGREGGREVSVPFARGIELPDRPGSAPLHHEGRHLRFAQVDGEAGTTITATWDERDGTAAALELRIDQPPGHESLNVVIPWSDRRFQYTSKHQARPAHGTLRIGDDERVLDGWGVLDVGRGRWPYRTRWNWGGGAGRTTDGSVVGLQVGGKWTAGTGFTENGVIVDGRLSKLGEELVWEYDWDAPMRPWRVCGEVSGLDLTLTPRFDRHTRVQALLLATEVHQVFGTWTGTVTTEDGRSVDVDGISGFAEESRSRW